MCTTGSGNVSPPLCYGVPMPKTNRSMRIDDDLWAKAQVQADRLGISMSAYVSILIAEYRVRATPSQDEAKTPPSTPVRAPVPFGLEPTRGIAAAGPDPGYRLTNSDPGPDPFDAIFAEQEAARNAASPPYDPTLDPDSRQFDKERARALAAPWDNIA